MQIGIKKSTPIYVASVSMSDAQFDQKRLPHIHKEQIINGIKTTVTLIMLIPAPEKNTKKIMNPSPISKYRCFHLFQYIEKFVTYNLA